MTPAGRWWPVAAPVLVGAGWGLTTPLVTVAVEGGHRPFGIIVWQLVIGAAILWPVQALRGQRLRRDAPAPGVHGALAALGALGPNAASCRAVEDRPAGLVAILSSTVPMFAFAVALAIGDGRVRPARLAGLGLGRARRDVRRSRAGPAAPRVRACLARGGRWTGAVMPDKAPS